MHKTIYIASLAATLTGAIYFTGRKPEPIPPPVQATAPIKDQEQVPTPIPYTTLTPLPPRAIDCPDPPKPQAMKSVQSNRSQRAQIARRRAIARSDLGGLARA